MPRVRARARIQLWFPAFAIVTVAWLTFWMAQGLPTACLLAYPCPRPDVRLAPALVFGSVMLVPFIAVVVLSRVRVPVRAPVGWLLRVSYVILVGLAVGGYMVISFSGGFVVDTAFLAGLLGTLGTAGLAYLGTAALGRDTSSAPTGPS